MTPTAPPANAAPREPFLVWPGWRHLAFAWTLSALNAAWFVLVYGGCDWLTAHRAFRVRLDLPFEQHTPFVPWTVVFYMSIYALFAAGPFIIRARREFAALVAALALSTAVAGLGFLLFPAQTYYPMPGNLGAWSSLYHVADDINLTYNLAPSLHVALSVGCIAAFSRHASSWGRPLLWAWALAIAASTLLTHQHYLVDAVSGWLLGWWTQRAMGRWCLPSSGSVR